MAANPKKQGHYNVPRFIGSEFAHTSELQCVRVFIPMGTEYRVQLMALLDVLTQKAAWFTETDDEREILAQQARAGWRETLAYIGDGCMDCDDIADCIETSERVRNAIRGALAGSMGYPPSQPMTGEKSSENLAGDTNPTCSYDALYGQCIKAVQWTNQAVEDVLEKIEVTSNIVELVDAFTDAPLVGWAKDLFGGELAVSLMEYYQDALREEYLAQYTQTLEDELACDIFCLCKDDCIINVDRIFEAYATRLSGYIILPELSDLVDIVEFIAGVSQDASFVVELAHWFAWGTAKLGNFFFADVFDGLVTEAIQGYVDDTGWLDCECPETWTSVMDFELDDYGWSSVGAFSSGSGANWALGVGMQSAYGVSSGNGYQMVQIAVGVTSCSITDIVIEFDMTNGQQTIGSLLPAFIGTNAETLVTRTTPFPDGMAQIYSWHGERDGVTQLSLRIQAGAKAGASNPGGASIVKRITVVGTGTKPPELP